MITWPENLIEELELYSFWVLVSHLKMRWNKTLFVLGSGVSATSQNEDGIKPKTWSAFLEDAKSLMVNKNCEVDFVDKMIAEKNFLMALQTIYADCDSGVYSDFLKKNLLVPNFNHRQYIKL